MIMLYQCLLLLVISAQFQSIASSRCKCSSDQELSISEEHLKLVTRITSLKIIPLIRGIIHQSEAERTYLLEIASFNILREIRSMYGKSLTHTDFVLNLQSLKVAINDIINDHQELPLHEINLAFWKIIKEFHSAIIPSSFICLSMGECRLADEEYMNCIKTHSHEWIHYFGKEPEKMTRRIAESIHRFRLLDQILTILHREVVSAEQSIDKNCVEQYSSVTGCRNCVADEIGYCRSSCKSVLSNCFSNLSMGWVDRLESLKRLSVDFEKGFYELERGIKSGHRKLVESNSPLLARAVVSRCGSVRDRFVPLGNISVIPILKPKDVKIKTERLIQQLQNHRDSWLLLTSQTCSQPSQQQFCWNGTNIIRTQISDDFLATKDVKPRPKETWLDASGRSPWDTDDEDIVDGSGSGRDSDMFNEEFTQTALHTVAPSVTLSPSSTSSTRPEIVNDIIKSSTLAYASFHLALSVHILYNLL